VARALAAWLEEFGRKQAWKVESSERLIRGINPEASVRAIRAKWQDEATTLRDADVIVGCLDSFGARFQLVSCN
jgi:tRNA A37 threonylcarbamoyladenosine dehydratase